MKKLVLILTLAGVLLFGGCKDNTVTPNDSQTDIQGNNQTNITAISDAVLDSSIFTEKLEEIDSKLIYALYGISEADVMKSVTYKVQGVDAEELSVIACTDTKAAQRVKEALELYVEDMIVSFNSYKPEDVVKLENAEIIISGTTVVYVAAEDPGNTKELVMSMINK